MLFRYIKEGFSAYSSPVMLISRKVTKDKRVISVSRHLKVRKAKNNLAYPLLKDTFSMLCSSRCEVFISVRFEGYIIFFKAFGKLKEILWNQAIFW